MLRNVLCVMRNTGPWSRHVMISNLAPSLARVPAASEVIRYWRDGYLFWGHFLPKFPQNMRNALYHIAPPAARDFGAQSSSTPPIPAHHATACSRVSYQECRLRPVDQSKTLDRRHAVPGLAAAYGEVVAARLPLRRIFPD